MTHLWREAEPEEFAATILAAAEQLGVIPLAVEKDYWVCEVLRGISKEHPGEVIFKGGTSLEKLRIIERFSEDLDLLLVDPDSVSRAPRRAMKQIMTDAGSFIDAKITDAQSGGEPGAYHRKGYLEPPLDHSEAPSEGIADPASVLLEMGQSGGSDPSDQRQISSLMGRQLLLAGFDVDAWDDLQSFDFLVLHPGRTLIEKLLRVNNFATPHEVPIHGLPRIGRQFYDIYQLLKTGEVRKLLEDKEEFGAILKSCYQVSAAFNGDAKPPKGDSLDVQRSTQSQASPRN
ncbi:nucleotidyl transferase AbiEii/AbiGii toxin family protein [Ornithinimicrobium sp. INDO-MA30-4]|uniref:nucleotidyl transferase AbiEii/AbiGii toxin family protein n=1 Tax=Ornithinimicrobium sp. INDO-MA30-4 TaxID=2908651 RepID=UPI001F15E0EE|nr:nucleotidyl transferase AbiEii/AbiGii toxin family protein [Ornithinimicrobium sp. INDO-MA30-4]UJH71829.1 nucleotidyl transferase AbiEii/AbiGii toxin family protein [Ornithinimicrobium sp. INDO-MA30-4]